MQDGDYVVRDPGGDKMLGAQTLEELHAKLGEQIGRGVRTGRRTAE
ncbi:hypothetical protein [Halobaculum sp. D14]